MTKRLAKPDLSQARSLVYVIGAQKAGTTWLYEQFADHPDVHFARKEFHYWNAKRSPYANFYVVPVYPVLGTLGKLRGRLGDIAMRLGDRVGDGVLAWRMVLSPPESHADYKAGLVRRIPRAGMIVGDITPAYAVLSAGTLAEMATLHPDVKFIFIMRDPVSRLWSGIRHRLKRWSGKPGVAPDLAARWFAMALQDDTNMDILASRYDETIRRLEAAGVGDRVLYMFYEDMMSDAGQARINSFLGISARPMNRDQKVLETASWPVTPTEAMFDHAAEVLKPTYDFVRSRFGAQVPKRWRGSADVVVPAGSDPAPSEAPRKATA